MKKKILSMVLAIATISILASCGGKDSLVGIWENVDENASIYSILELYDDGTAINKYGTGRYVSTENNLTLLNMGVIGTKSEYSYELKGDSLKLTDEDGDVMEFTRSDR